MQPCLSHTQAACYYHSRTPLLNTALQSSIPVPCPLKLLHCLGNQLKDFYVCGDIILNSIKPGQPAWRAAAACQPGSVLHSGLTSFFHLPITSESPASTYMPFLTHLAFSQETPLSTGQGLEGIPGTKWLVCLLSSSLREDTRSSSGMQLLNLTAVSCNIVNIMHSIIKYLLSAGCISGAVPGTEETRHLLNVVELMRTVEARG